MQFFSPLLRSAVVKMIPAENFLSAFPLEIFQDALAPEGFLPQLIFPHPIFPILNLYAGPLLLRPSDSVKLAYYHFFFRVLWFHDLTPKAPEFPQFFSPPFVFFPLCLLGLVETFSPPGNFFPGPPPSCESLWKCSFFWRGVSRFLWVFIEPRILVFGSPLGKFFLRLFFSP